MRVFIAFLFFTFLISNNLFAQDYPFEKGLIIKKTNDTICALVELSPYYEYALSYKMNAEAKVQRIKIKEIKSLITPYNKFQNITLKKEELLFREVINGNTSLLEYSKINIGTSKDAYGGTMTYYNPPTIIYVIRTKENDFIIKKKKDILQISQLLESCQDAKALVEQKSFKLEDLKEVINYLNK